MKPPKKTQSALVHFADEVGIFFEKSGMPRIAGKIYGLLLISEHPHLSTDEIAEQLTASRGSVSTMTRMLIEAGIIDKIRVPGERQDSFRIRSLTFSQLLKAKLDQTAEFHKVIDKGFALFPEKNSTVYERLKELHDFVAFFQKELGSLFERWELQQKQRRKI
ncbi:MAG: winged helix-turn-helix transcriptional regulator [Bacteroidota bacterium]|nr:winged helix-turn-helix transcriptional regulator [Bacteroidota bacterium]